MNWKTLCFILVGYISAMAQVVPDSERIISYKTDIKVDNTTTIDVTETIKVYAKGDDIKRGIFRVFPLSRSLAGKDVDYKIKIISVKKDGKEESTHKEYSENLTLYIGDQDIILPEGLYEYEIHYKATKQIGFFKDYDELYWNATGNFWDFPIDHCQATITFPKNANILQSACYTGFQESNCSYQKINNHIIVFKADSLAPKQGLTIASGIPKGIIPEPLPPSFLETYGVAILGLVFIIIGCYLLYRKWNTYGRDPIKPTVIPQFTPPNEFSPAEMGYIDGGFSTKLITAAFTNLAVRQYIKIEEIDKKNYKIIKLKKPDHSLSQEEQIIMKTFFINDIKDYTLKKYDEKVSRMAIKFYDNIDNRLKHLKKIQYNLDKILKIIIGYFVSIILLYSIHAYIFDDYARIILMPIFTAINLCFFGAIFLFFLRYKFIRGLYLLGAIAIPYFYIVNFIVQTENPESISLNCIALYCLIGNIILTFAGYLMRAPNAEGVKIKSEIDGFKMYLKTAEEQLMKFHNPPKMTPEIFQKYLPYAIAFGVEEIWGEKFSSVLSTMPEEEVKAFHTVMIPSISNQVSSNFSSFIHNVSSSAYTASGSGSSSRSSSSFGGSSGGGFSGGGGGGGGGGGW